jgi:MYXO-CTERM domain-containing protein
MTRGHWFPALRAAMLTVLVSGCSGGGCSGCAGGALGPSPGGYPLTPETRVPHAIQVRLTTAGLAEIQRAGPDLINSATGGVITVPTLRGNFGVGRYIVCPDPPRATLTPEQRTDYCRLNLRLPTSTSPLELTPRPPDSLNVKLHTGLQGLIAVHTCSLACNDDCRGLVCLDSDILLPVDTMRMETPMRRGYIGLETAVAIRRDTHAPRLSYHRADLVSPTGMGEVVQPIANETFDAASISCMGTLCGLFPLLAPTFTSTFGGAIGGAVTPLRDALAQTSMPSPPGCPTGTRVEGARCRYSDNELVPSLLGTELTGNVGALLQSFSAGVRAEGSILIAAGDPMRNAEVDATGLTLNLFGAARSLRHSACVPQTMAPALPTIPEFPSLRTNMMPGTGRVPHLALGVAEQYLNHTLWNLWDSGLFCLGVTSSLAPDQLNTMLFSVLIRSLPTAVYPAAASPIAITLRPQRPPRIRVLTARPMPTSPVLELGFERLALDFYLWSEERYVRAMTVTTDVTIPLGFADMMGLRPVLGEVATANTEVTRAALVSEEPMTLAVSVGSILGVAFGRLGGSIPAITLPSIPLPAPMGAAAGTISLRLPADSFRGVEESSQRFLGVYADLSYAGPRRPLTATAETAATLVELTPAGPDARVRLRLDASASIGRGEYEFAWRVDDLTWSHWTRDTDVTVRSPAFEFEGAHQIEVRARRVEEPDSVDPEGAAVPFTLAAREIPRPVAPSAPVAANDRLIRGGPSTNTSGGCGCTTQSDPSREEWALAGLALAVVMRRRRRAT